MVDIMNVKQVPQISACIRGTKRLDHVLVTSDLIDAVRASGCEPFHCRLQSDHRGCFIDFDMKKLFSNETTRLAKVTQREFSAKCPRSVHEHVQQLNKHLEANSFFRDVQALKDMASPNHAEAEKLDRTLAEGMMHAAKTCRRYRRDWWSLPFSQALNRQHLARKALSGHLNGCNLKDQLECQAQEQQIDWEHPKDLPAAQQLLQKATNELRDARTKSRELRDECMDKLAEDHATSQNQDKEKMVKAMKNKENDCHMWSRFKRSRGKNKKSGFTSIRGPQDWPTTEESFRTNGASNPKQCQDDNWRTIELPDEVNFCLRMRNQLHFRKAQGTPFTVPPLSTQVDWTANTAESEMTLDGTCSNDELDDITQLLINNCKRRQAAILEKSIEIKQWKKRMKKWRKTTSTSPSGLHLGHCKAMINRFVIPDEELDPTLTETEQRRNFESTRNAMLQAKIDLINCTTTHRRTCKRWKTIANSMIEKDPGDNRMHRLRVMHLCEADLAMLLGIHWKHMLKSATKLNAINLSQCGGMPGEEATSPAFVEELKHDISCATQKSLFDGDNDADSCYDRMIPALASMLGRKHGLHRNVTFVHATTLKAALCKLKTTKGVSEECYQHCQAFPIHRSGQGSTDSPVMWIIISSCLFNAHRSAANGACFCTPDKSMSITLSMVGFVDDSTINANRFLDQQQPSPSEMLEICKNDAQLWNDLLWVSGGMLELKKCSYHLAHFEFDDDGTPRMQASFPELEDLELIDAKTGVSVVMKRKTACKPHKTLGHERAPAGKGKTQLQRLHDKSIKLLEQSPRCLMQPHEALRCCNCTHLKSMEHVLPQSYFDEAQLDNLDRRAQQTFTRRSGLSGSMALPIRHGPAELAGAAMTRLSTTQGEGQIMNFLKHWRSGSNVGKIL